MTGTADRIEATARRLRDELGVEAGLAAVAERLLDVEDPSDALEAVHQQLRSRGEALQRAAREVVDLAGDVRRLRTSLPFSPDGWPRERARLADLADRDPMAAAGAWWGYVVAAAADRRLDAIDRLVEDAPLPPELAELRERTRTCLLGLQAESWALAAPMLRPGLDRPRSLARYVRSRDVARLRLLLARLALADGRPAEVEPLLAEDPDLAASGAGLELSARAARALGADEQADSLGARARARAPHDLDVASGLIASARAEDLRSQALEIARGAVEALPSLVDVEHELGRLLSPPAELWVAAVERLVRDGWTEESLRLLDDVSRIVQWDDHLTAVLAALRASTLEGSARAEALLETGNVWVAVLDIPAARAAFDDALASITAEEHPDLWAALVFRQADCVVVSSTTQPLALVRDELEATLSRVHAAQDVPGAVKRDPWCWALVCELRLSLARDRASDRTGHAWHALLAAARRTALRPALGRSWEGLAQTVGIWSPHLALTYAAHAEALGGDDQEASIVALVNAGDRARAATLLEGRTDPWATSVLGFLTLRRGAPDEAARLLGSVPLDPSWTFAHETWLQALVLAGRPDAAATEAGRILADGGDRLDEFEQVVSAAAVSLFHGDAAAGVGLAASATRDEVPLDRGVAALTLGQALLLGGEPDRGLEVLAEALQRRNALDLDDWRDVERPVLEALAAAQGRTLPALDTLDAAVARRRAELAAAVDGLARLEDAEAPASDPTLPGRVLPLVRALGAVALGDTEGARSGLEALDPDLHAERVSLGAHLDESSPPDIADGADGTERDPAVGTDPAVGEPPSDALEEEQTLALNLPASWFTGYTDPVTQHEIFLHDLPALRHLCAWPVPRVRVVADADLEPDRFRVVGEDGRTLDEGRVRAEARAVRADRAAVLPDHLRESAEPDGTGLVWIPVGAFRDGDDLARLLSRSGAEVALEHLAEVARSADPAAAPAP